MTNIEIITICISITSSFLILLGVVYADKQVDHIRKQNEDVHKWNRIKTSFDMNLDLANGGYTKTLDELKKLAEVPLKGKTYEEVIALMKIEKRLAFDSKLNQLLNYFEVIAIGINNKILNKDISYEFAALIYVTYYEWSESFIARRRTETESPTFYSNVQNLAELWRERIDKEQEQLEKSLITDGLN